MTLTASRACELFIYDPEDGSLRRRIAVKGHRRGSLAGSTKVNGYRGVMADGRLHYAHRLIWLMVTGEWPEADIDHINGDRSSNQWDNLRLATRTQNNGNARRRKDNSSGFKGVSLHRETGKWRAAIWNNGRKRHIGLFKTPELAHEAYMTAAEQYFGEFAKAA